MFYTGFFYSILFYFFLFCACSVSACVKYFILFYFCTYSNACNHHPGRSSPPEHQHCPRNNKNTPSIPVAFPSSLDKLASWFADASMAPLLRLSLQQRRALKKVLLILLLVSYHNSLRCRVYLHRAAVLAPRRSPFVHRERKKYHTLRLSGY